MSKRILHCIWSMRTGGTEEMLIDIMTRQAQKHQVHLVIVNDLYDKEMLDKIPASVKVHLLRRNPGSRNPWSLVKLNLLALSLRPHIIHMHNRQMPSVMLPFWKRNKVLTVHALGQKLVGYKRVGTIVAISESVRYDLQRRYGINAKIVHNGIDFNRIAVRQPRPFDGTLRIVQVGRLFTQEKGQDWLVRAIAYVKDRGYDNVHATFIGEGPDHAMLSELAVTLAANTHIEFIGRKDKQWIYDHLCDFDLMVHPARSEGFGLAIAEAMAAGLPLAVSDYGGPYEVTDNGRYALTFTPDAPVKVANAILRAMRDYPHVLEKAEQGRRYACNNYSIDATVAAYDLIYDKNCSLEKIIACGK